MKLLSFALLLVIGLSSCTINVPTEPLIQSSPTITGKWDVVFDTNNPGLMDVTEKSGNVTGTLTVGSETQPVKGTLSKSGKLYLSGPDTPDAYFNVKGSVNTKRTLMSATIRFFDSKTDELLAASGFTANKR